MGDSAADLVRKPVLAYGVTAAMLVAWTALFAVSVAFAAREDEDNSEQIARSYDRAAAERDLLVHTWAAEHSPVYLPVDEPHPGAPRLEGNQEHEVVTTAGVRLAVVDPTRLTRDLHELAARQGTSNGRLASLERADVHWRNTLGGQSILWLCGVLCLLVAGALVSISEQRRRRAVFDQIQADRQRIRDLHREAQAREDMIALLMESTDEYEDGIIEVERRQGDLLEGQERLRKVNERLEELANTDLLTRLYNRRKGNAILADEWARVRRRVCHLGVVMIDLDHFKRINDTYGHAAGDVVLSTVADRIRETLRAYDSPVRWGGEEMLAVCPDASTTDAAAVAERLRVAIGGEAIQIGGGVTIHVTASLGVASSELGGYTSVEELIEAADSALYRAKHGGRDQVCWSGRPGSIGIPRADGSVPGPFHIESC